MPRFYVDPSNIFGDRMILEGGEYNHLKNVLRKQVGDTLLICDGEGHEYDCRIAAYENGNVILSIEETRDGNTELSISITLYQGLPKKDKFEWILEKAVELGAVRIVPVACARSVAKWDDPAREDKKLKRFQAIAEAASKQCGRGVIPEVGKAVSFAEAIKEAKQSNDIILFPYENAEGMKATEEVIKSIRPGQKIAVFIGPEGGFAPEEVTLANDCGAQILSLGRRILRTETAAMTMLSYLMIQAETLG
ncbi:MAG: 16S rRNA (uracil(1498)-N(3))-methyltransferase [Lachnospiraceae bacterium]|nr:16S rRNA (uracil(1498)-N(3))-methyltransferase [Lachnospiraceae bacterium]